MDKPIVSGGFTRSLRTENNSSSDSKDDPSSATLDSSNAHLRGRQLLLNHSIKRALSCLKDGEFGRAFAHYVVVFTVQPSMFHQLHTQFLLALEKYTSKLKTEGRYEDALKCFEQVLEIFPDHPDVLHELGSLFYGLDYLEEALVQYQKAYLADPYFSHSLYCLENLKNIMVEKWHFLMLNDKKRNLAFYNSVEQAVKSGYTRVLDIGSGTGILSMMAVDSGAQEVYACEKNQYMCEILKNVIKANGKSDCVHVLEKLSTSLAIPCDIPERVNLVVTETFDAGLFGEHILKTLEHAWEELLCSNHPVRENTGTLPDHAKCDDAKYMQVSAKVIPYSATLWAVPVECDRIREYTRLNCGTSISVSASVSEPYTSERIAALTGGFKYLSSPQHILQVNFNDLQEIKRLLKGVDLNLQYKCSDGILDAFVMWFDLNLDDVVTLSSAPDHDGCWEQAIFYVLPQHLKGTSKILQTEDTVCATFHCEGHISLLEVKTPHFEDPPPLFHVTCKPEIIYQTNFLVPSMVHHSELWKKKISRETGPVIDLFPLPLLGIRALQEGATQLIVFDSETQNQVERLMEMRSVSKRKVIIMPNENYKSCSLKAGLLFHHPVDMCGLLKKGIFETIHHLRTTCLKQSAFVIPGKLEVLSTLIDSPSLTKQTKLVSDDNTISYQISSSINIYQGLLHFNIDLSALPYEKLCGDIRLCEFDFNASAVKEFNDVHGSVEIEITRNGKISAAPFWFIITYHEDTFVNTSNSKTLFHVAASIPIEEIEVIQGDCVVLHWACKNSCFYVNVDKK